MLRLAPALALGILLGPVIAGLLGSVLPAFGYLPALGGTAFSPEPWRQIAATPGIVTSAWLSLYTGLAATAASLAAVTLFIAAWHGTRLFGVMQHLISPLLSVPHAAAAFGFAFLIAPSGWIARLLSPGLTGWVQPPDVLIVHDPLGLAMLAGLVVKEIPFLLLVSLAALPQTDARRTAQVAASLGYGRVTGWFKTVFPRLYPQIRLPVWT